MSRSDRDTFTVSEDADVIIAGCRAKALMGEFEFDERTIREVVLVVHELASNIVKHAGDGSIELSLDRGERQNAIEIQASDSGPGIADVDQAVIDGYSTVGSLGGGLGAVHRLMDDVVFHSNGTTNSGVKIVASRRCSTSTLKKRSPPVEIDAATRPHPGYDQNGDAVLIEHGANSTLVGVIDGLGHGPEAYRAAKTARQYVETHPTKPLADLFAGVEEACRPTRGVVMLLARFDWDDQNVLLGSVGNITLKVCESAQSRHLVPQRGVVGDHAPSPTIDEWNIHPTLVMVVHTDGISSKWNCDEIDWHDKSARASAADRLLREFSKPDDDATVLVVRGSKR